MRQVVPSVGGATCNKISRRDPPPHALSLKITRICFVFWPRLQALEAVNTRLREIYPESEELFDVVLVTNNHAYVGLRLINTINHHRE